ncbi:MULTISPECIES: hypothetical protein [Corallococcus]|uniref:hypothetical protein n=1 Tax=Corallococcus TaxID=83461 RepID=UPI000EDAFE5F|nr:MULTISPECIES: hypothetical protein [Corallococcus]NPD27270.1 hypothetical protein [Corallococcus exiguus]NRD51089.1 hypothetical protein [Corallococcus exiguus]RKH95345.1 hypothetical protein D7Y04_34180 [Corallococcus sp. AB038B]
MRLSFIAALLSVGFFAGCGGVVQEAQEAEVTAMAPPPCERACITLYNHCMRTATTPEQQAWCVEDQDLCFQGCDLGAAPVRVQALPPCQDACYKEFLSCARAAKTPEDALECVNTRNDCYQACE